MSDDIAIRVENLSKRYIIRHQRAGGNGLRHVLQDMASAPFRLFKRGTNGALHGGNVDATSEEFWALNNVSFEVNRGQVVGIIGRNGAGKSTLLKVLSRITEPTKGRITINGRVASLLEVGTGFHFELTGRENIYLNGAILGMTHSEIKSKFDEIVDFAEIEKFLDTPVKRYSSGMYIRLAFAVAAHLEPEILIVDEVLAVGDMQFQKKCLGKMQEVSQKHGRTILFVSHNMPVIQTLCSRCIVLRQGQVVIDASPTEAKSYYMMETIQASSFEFRPPADGKAHITAGSVASDTESGRAAVRIDVTVESPSEQKLSLDVRLEDRSGTPIGYGSLGSLDKNQMIQMYPGMNSVSLLLPIDQLANGSYFVSLDLIVPSVEFLDRLEHCLHFDVERPPTSGNHHVTLQEWGKGSVELTLSRIRHEPLAAN